MISRRKILTTLLATPVAVAAAEVVPAAGTLRVFQRHPTTFGRICSRWDARQIYSTLSFGWYDDEPLLNKRWTITNDPAVAEELSKEPDAHEIHDCPDWVIAAYHGQRDDSIRRYNEYEAAVVRTAQPDGSIEEHLDGKIRKKIFPDDRVENYFYAS